jgi:TonB-dependent starch-binding outer membrane protein SusC
MTKKLLFLSLFILLTSVAVFAQKAITGKVTDETGDALPGVNILLKGTSNGTVTDAEGRYSISVPENADPVLTFSFIGYEGREEPVGSRLMIDVTMQPDIKTLNEVIVVGYGTTKEKDLTGSVVSMTTKNLPSVANSSINSQLQGRIPGLNIGQQSAQPGGRLNVNIRGQGTPLYVIDGVPIFNARSPEPSINSYSNAAELGFSGGVDRDPLNSINPADIESVTVLKDASAAAIYGSAAANGVILITTKKGKADGRVTAEYRGSYTVQTPKPYYDLLNATEFMQQQVRLSYDQFLNTNNLAPYGNSTATPVFTPKFTYADMAAAGVGTDWLDLMMRDGSINEHNIALSGGSEATKVYTGFNYYDNKAILENSDFVRYSGRLNVEQKIGEKLKLSVNLTMSQTNSNNASSGAGGQGEKFNSLQAAYAFSPALDILDDNGNYTRTLNTQITNPAAFLIIKDKLRSTRFFVNPNLEYKFSNAFKINLVGGIDKQKADRKMFLPRKAQNFLFPDGIAQLATSSVNNYSVEGYGTYTKAWNDHDISVVGGGGYYKSFDERFDMQGVGFFTDALGYDNIGLATNIARNFLGSNRSPNAIKISQFFRANYSFKSKYFLTFTARNDGSSNFAANKKWGFFPGVSAAWRIKDEAFLSGVQVLSDLKLRIGYGTVGNDANLSAIALYSSAGGQFLIGNTYYPSVSLSQLENPNLSWETVKTTNIGLDFGLVNDRLTGSLELFRTDRVDIITITRLPINNAVSSFVTNQGGSQRRQGVDFSISSQNLEGELGWTTTFNISTYNNRWLERNPFITLQPYEKEDDRTDVVYGWKTRGILKTDDERPAYMPNARLGNIIYEDVNNDGVLDVKDVVRLGHATPKWIFGFGNRFTYKGFDLDVFLYGRLNAYMNNDLAGFYEPGRIGVPQGLNTLKEIKNVWSNDNPDGIYPGVAADAYTGSNPSGTNDYYRENVNFARIRNITLGYTFKANRVIRAARVFVDVQNVALMTNYDGFDPELSQTLNPGVQPTPNPYPPAMSTTVGLNLTF